MGPIERSAAHVGGCLGGQPRADEPCLEVHGNLRLSADMANTDGRTLGEVLRDARVAADLTLRDLAKKLAITASYISDIENDRRVPSEDVLERIASELKLKFDELMARAGRVGDQAEKYMKRHPSAGVLFRRISERRLPEEDLKRLLTQVEEMGTKKGT